MHFYNILAGCSCDVVGNTRRSMKYSDHSDRDSVNCYTRSVSKKQFGSDTETQSQYNKKNILSVGENL